MNRVTSHIEIPHQSDATGAELAETAAGWCLTLVRRSGPPEQHNYFGPRVIDGIPGGDKGLEVESIVAHFESRLEASGYDPAAIPAHGNDLAAWDLSKR